MMYKNSCGSGQTAGVTLNTVDSGYHEVQGTL